MKKKRLVVIWDTKIHPLSFDIVQFFAICHLLSINEGLDGTFHVILRKRGYRKIGIEANYSEWHQERKFRNVILQMTSLCKWVAGYQVCYEDEAPLISSGDIVFPSTERRMKLGNVPEWVITPMTSIQIEKIYESGSQIKSDGFVASADLKNEYQQRFGHRALILQLRQSIHTSARNFPLDVFVALIKHFKKNGFNIFFIPDVENPEGQDLFSESGAVKLLAASYDYEHRLACSEAALLNINWVGGIVAPLAFANVNFVSLGLLNNLSNVSTEEYFSRKGPSIHKQPPWFKKNRQYYDWCPSEKVDASHIISMVQQRLDLLEQS